jgi:hypothetical protein
VDTSVGYPAFIDWRGVTTDEFEARAASRLTSWLRTSLAYRHVESDYDTRTDPVATLSPGGQWNAANYKAHLVTLNATLTPWPRLHLSPTLSYQKTDMDSHTGDNGAVVPYQGDVVSALLSGTYILSQRTDLLAAYSFSWADYAQDNEAAGLPLGIHYRLHALTTGLSHRLSRRVTTRLQYGFYHHEEPSSGGANDYTAHAVFTTLSIRLP